MFTREEYFATIGDLGADLASARIEESSIIGANSTNCGWIPFTELLFKGGDTEVSGFME